MQGCFFYLQCVDWQLYHGRDLRRGRGYCRYVVVSSPSEADVSGVSLVMPFNRVLIFRLTALSAGGAVIISQYIGSKMDAASGDLTFSRGRF